MGWLDCLYHIILIIQLILFNISCLDTIIDVIMFIYFYFFRNLKRVFVMKYLLKIVPHGLSENFYLSYCTIEFKIVMSQKIKLKVTYPPLFDFKILLFFRIIASKIPNLSPNYLLLIFKLIRSINL